MPDAQAERIRNRIPDETFSSFARQALQEKLERLERKELAREMLEGYAVRQLEEDEEADWESTEAEAWEWNGEKSGSWTSIPSGDLEPASAAPLSSSRVISPMRQARP